MFWIFGHEACGILALCPEIKPARPALEGGLNHWTTLDFHICICFESTGLITSNPRHPEASLGPPESPQSPPGCVPFSPGILLKVFFFFPKASLSGSWSCLNLQAVRLQERGAHQARTPEWMVRCAAFCQSPPRAHLASQWCDVQKPHSRSAVAGVREGRAVQNRA